MIDPTPFINTNDDKPPLQSLLNTLDGSPHSAYTIDGTSTAFNVVSSPAAK